LPQDVGRFHLRHPPPHKIACQTTPIIISEREAAVNPIEKLTVNRIVCAAVPVSLVTAGHTEKKILLTGFRVERSFVTIHKSFDVIFSHFKIFFDVKLLHPKIRQRATTTITMINIQGNPHMPPHQKCPDPISYSPSFGRCRAPQRLYAITAEALPFVSGIFTSYLSSFPYQGRHCEIRHYPSYQDRNRAPYGMFAPWPVVPALRP